MKIFNADRQKNLETNNLLQKIKYEVDKFQAGEDRVFLPILELNNGQLIYQMNPTDKSLLQKFKKWGIIELFERDLKEANRSLKNSKLKGLIVEGVLIKLVEPKFSQFCKKYEDKINEKSDKKINKRLEEKQSNKKRTKKINLYLNQNGDLYKKPKNKYCYQMREGSKRHRLIKFLCENKGYQKTSLITNQVGYNNDEITGGEIRKIKNNINNFLKINDEKVLESKKGSGYKINLKYKIKLINK